MQSFGTLSHTSQASFFHGFASLALQLWKKFWMEAIPVMSKGFLNIYYHRTSAFAFSLLYWGNFRQ